MRLWMLSAGTLGVALAMGLALGSFVTSVPANPLTTPSTLDNLADATDDDGSTTAVIANQEPTVPIRCTGCGPTLADRRYEADMRAIYGPHDSEPVTDDPAPLEAAMTPPVMEEVRPQRVATLGREATSPDVELPIPVEASVPESRE
jgi:hypothetical protein